MNDDSIEALIAEARSKSIATERCAILPLPEVPNVLVDGWSICLSVLQHKSTECWHLSIMLFPPGRSSSSEDWKKLGKLLAQVCHLIGYPGEEAPDPITPIESTHPNLALHWHMHSDGSPIEERALAAMREFFLLREAYQPKDGTWRPKK